MRGWETPRLEAMNARALLRTRFLGDFATVDGTMTTFWAADASLAWANGQNGWKPLFGRPVVVRDLLRGFAAQLVELFDLRHPAALLANWVVPDGEQYQGDVAWPVSYADGWGHSMVLLFELQCMVDDEMAVGMLRYETLARDALRRQGELEADGELRPLSALHVGTDAGMPALRPHGASTGWRGSIGAGLPPWGSRVYDRSRFRNRSGLGWQRIACQVVSKSPGFGRRALGRSKGLEDVRPPGAGDIDE